MSDTVSYGLVGAGLAAVLTGLTLVLRAWADQTLQIPAVVKRWPAAWLQHKVGAEIGDLEWAAQVSPSSAADYMVHGPGIDLPSGSYAAAFRLRSDGQAPPLTRVVFLEVFTREREGDRGRVLAERPVYRRELGPPDTYRRFTVPFRLEAPATGVEFRVLFDNAVDVVVHSVGLLTF